LNVEINAKKKEENEHRKSVVEQGRYVIDNEMFNDRKK
jgi:hypothetical protein